VHIWNHMALVKIGYCDGGSDTLDLRQWLVWKATVPNKRCGVILRKGRDADTQTER